jgi:two-component system, response regulator PdtaR
MSGMMKTASGSVVATSTAKPKRRAGERARRILIVEDNQFVARQCESVLVDAGYEVVAVVTSADDAIRVALERQPQLILMDIYLPGKRDGVDAAIEIFERFGIRSIFASAPADAADRARAESARPLAWLPKPFSDKKLLTTVESAIANAKRLGDPSLILKSVVRNGKHVINVGPEAPTPRALIARTPAPHGAGDRERQALLANN